MCFGCSIDLPNWDVFLSTHNINKTNFGLCTLIERPGNSLFRHHNDRPFIMWESLLFPYWIFFHGLLLSVDFFQNRLFLKILSGIPSVSNTLDLDQA